MKLTMDESGSPASFESAENDSKSGPESKANGDKVMFFFFLFFCLRALKKIVR